MSLIADVRFALRMMAKHVGVTTVLILTLGLGIGASTTIFSVVDAVLIKPLPYPQPGQLVRVYTEFVNESGRTLFSKFRVSPPEYFELAGSTRSFSSIGAWEPGAASLSGGDRPVHIRIARVTASFLPTMGVAPALGRTLGADEDRPGAAHAVVLSDALWRRVYGADPAVIGRKVMLDAVPATIVGVMPAGFGFPDDEVEAWTPLGLDPASTRWGNHNENVVARLGAGVTIAQARSELDTLMDGWAKGRGHGDAHVLSRDRHPVKIFPLKDEVVGSLTVTLWLLQGAVLFVLLIAIANVANLLLARAEARSREIAVRHALGANRRRLVRQFLTESVVLGVAGGGLGILAAVWALDVLIAILPHGVPRAGEIHLDAGALWFATACTLGASLVFGLAPVLHTRVDDLPGALKEGGTRATASRSRRRLRQVLVVSEIAIATVLVIGCGMMIRSFLRLQRVDLGFEPDHLLTMEVDLPGRTYPDAKATTRFWRELEDRARALPGVTRATVVAGMPPSRHPVDNDLALPGRTPDPKNPWNVAFWQAVGDDALPTLGTRLLAGRALDARDAAGAPHVVLVNQAFARRFFPGEDPVGQLVQLVPWKQGEPPQRVVGLVEDMKQHGIDQPSGTEIYFSVRQVPDFDPTGFRRMYVVVRTAGDPRAMAPALERVLASIDPTLPAAHVRTMDDLVWEAVARPRFLTLLLLAFAGLAVALAGIGIYGVMSYSVVQRTHEIGIRMALGATPAAVRRMILRQAAVLAAIGLVIGVAAAAALEVALGGRLTALMYRVDRADPILFAGVCVLVLGIALVASYLPARRATRVAPTTALRSE